MPQRQKYHTPDAIDLQNQVSALGQDFGLLVVWSFRVEYDFVVLVARAYKPGGEETRTVEYQAIVRTPVRSKPDITQMAFRAVFDLWHQADRGVLGSKPPDVAHGWNGRPAVARRD